jgi:recombination associated protein RdgC
MKLIKACRVYAAELPPVNELEPILGASKFTELTELQGDDYGFVPLLNDRYVLDFGCGFAFKLRYDQKILPTSVIKSQTDKRVAEIEATEDRKVPAKERQAVKNDVIFTLLPKAFAKENTVTCFYWKKDNLLIVPTASAKLADITISALIRAVGSIKTHTIHVDGIKQSLTSKLKTFLETEVGIMQFDFDSTVKLKAEEGRVTTIKGVDLAEAKEGILEAIAQGSSVAELGLSTSTMFFRLSHDFVIRGVSFFGEDEPDEFDDEVDAFKHHASLQTIMMSDSILKLMDLFEYKSPEDEGQTVG